MLLALLPLPRIHTRRRRAKLLEDVRALAVEFAALPLAIIRCALLCLQRARPVLLVVLPVALVALPAVRLRAARKVADAIAATWATVVLGVGRKKGQLLPKRQASLRNLVFL